MSQPTYTARVIVLRKTKLGESDLIVTLLARDGSQIRAVAKGARKPQSPFASRLELYAVADVLCSRGRSLDIVKEARLAAGNACLRTDVELSAAAAAAAELVERVTHLGLENERLFALTEAAFAALDDAPAPRAPSIAAAHLLKAFAFAGLRPSLDACAACGSAEVSRGDGRVAFSAREGGVVCPACRARVEATSVPEDTVAWARFLLGSTFASVLDAQVGVGAAFEVLELCQQWSLEHVGSRLRSLTFLFTSGLYQDEN